MGKHVAIGGVIAFHDSLNSPGVTRFIIEAIRSGKFNQFETLDSYAGLTYMIKANSDESLLESDISTSIDRINTLAKKRIIPRLTGMLGTINPFGNRRFK